MNELVILKENKAVTTSLKVAESFGKKHRNVMQSIKNLTAENSAVKKMFAQSTYVNVRGQEWPMFYMNRDGFSLLVMGFTGKKALDFKLKYIDAFNKMEQTIKEGGLLASHLSPEEIQLKKAYIEEMQKQNDNKAHQLRDKAGQWHYYTSAVKLMEANALEIKDYEENHIEEE